MTDYRFRVLLVAGVSGKKQLGPNKFSIPRQLADGRDLCARRDWPVVKEITIPGKSRYLVFLEDLLAKSPEFRDILKTIRSGEIDLIVVRHSDRLFRTQELQRQLMAICWEHRVQVGDINAWKEPVPPDQLKIRAIDKFVDSIQGFRAEDEIEKFRDRVRGSMEARITERHLGGNHSHPPYGYRRIDRDQPLQLVDTEARWLRRMRDLRYQRLGWQAIAKRVNDLGSTIHGRKWTRVSIRRVLHNRFYWGDVWWSGVKAKGAHQPIFAEADWIQLRALDDEMRGQHPRAAESYELSGLCRCAICGSSMSVHISTRRKPWHNQRLTLLCSRSLHGYDGRMDPSERHTNYHNHDAVVAYLIRRAQLELADPDAFAAMRRQEIGDVSAEALAQIDAQLRERRQQWVRWDEAYEQGIIGPDELRTHRQRIHAAVETLKAERERLEARLAAAQNLDHDARRLSELVQSLPGRTPAGRREVWLQLLRAVWLTSGQDPRPEWR